MLSNFQLQVWFEIFVIFFFSGCWWSRQLVSYWKTDAFENKTCAWRGTPSYSETTPGVWTVL